MLVLVYDYASGLEVSSWFFISLFYLFGYGESSLSGQRGLSFLTGMETHKHTCSDTTFSLKGLLTEQSLTPFALQSTQQCSEDASLCPVIVTNSGTSLDLPGSQFLQHKWAD